MSLSQALNQFAQNLGRYPDEDSYSEHSFAETDDDREAQAIDAALDSLDALIRG